jgi:hypothetical protein
MNSITGDCAMSGQYKWQLAKENAMGSSIDGGGAHRFML